LPNFATLAIAILPGNWQNSGQNNFAPTLYVLDGNGNYRLAVPHLPALPILDMKELMIGDLAMLL
jgi:hypothetical protein